MAKLCWKYVLCGFISFLLPCVKGVTEDDVKECGTYIFGRVLCTSVNGYYRECLVPGATSIDLIKINENYTASACSFGNTFGFRGNSVWVNMGCSGEFYVCYEGVRVSTDYPVLTVTVTPPPGKTSGPDVALGSTSPGSDNIVLYIIIVVVVVLIVGVGLLVGCCVKQRQHRDRAQHLAEKRQASIDQREHKHEIEENAISLPMATRSLSMESVHVSSTTRTGNSSSREIASATFEQEGSTCSSNMSEFTSVSAQTTGHIVDNVRQFPASDKRSSSVSDVFPIGIYSEVGAIPKLNRSDPSSQSSLESIREVCNKYQMVDIPIERRYKKKSDDKNKFSTIGFAESQHIPQIKSGTLTLPIKRSKTRAVVHVNPPHVPKDDQKLKSTGCYVTSFEQHYQDPDVLNIVKPIHSETKDPYVSVDDKRLSTEADEEYAEVGMCKRQNVGEQTTESAPIYATVTKSCLKAPTSDSPNNNGSFSVSFGDGNTRKREANNNRFPVHGKEYTYLTSFKPPTSAGETNNPKDLPSDLTATSI